MNKTYTNPQDSHSDPPAIYERQMISAINNITRLLLNEDQDDYSHVLEKALDRIGATMSLSRLSLWHNQMLHDGQILCKRMHVWPRANTCSLPESFSPEKELGESWETRLQGGLGRDMLVGLPEEADNPQLVLPLTLAGTLWGMIVCHGNGGTEAGADTERVFSNAEREFIQTGGLLLVSAITRREMNRSLARALTKAEESSAAKSRFLATISHEIRNPMNAIVGMAAIAQRTEDTAKAKECLEKIGGAARILLSILNDVLDMSKMQSNRFTLSHEKFSLSRMLEHVTRNAEDHARDKRQTLRVELDEALPDWLMGDELRLTQVTSNLLANAIKFTPPQGEIIFRVRQVGDDGHYSRIEFAISDNGIGIPQNKQESIFSAFEQVESSARRSQGGTGLGLTISRNIVEHMGGHLTLQSEEGSGSTFSFTIELEGASSLAPGMSGPSSRFDFSGKHVLLAEDIEINRVVVMSLLENTGVQIDCAENGQAAVDLFKRYPERYDLIFMDVHMPVMDGLQATREIRAFGTKRAKAIPIVAMTANAFAEDVQTCKRAGMNDHLSKPIDVDLMLSKANSYIGPQATPLADRPAQPYMGE